MKKILLVCLIVLSGCASKAKVTSLNYGGQNNFQGAQNISDKSIRYISKFEAGKYLCDSASNRHNEQRLIADIKPNIAFFNTVTGKLEIANSLGQSGTKIYDSKIPPFNMVGCISEINNTPWSKVANKFISELGLPLIKYGTGYAVAKSLLTKLNEPRVQGNDNRVVLGDNNDYTEAGGIPLDNGIDASNLAIVSVEEESED